MSEQQYIDFDDKIETIISDILSEAFGESKRYRTTEGMIRWGYVQEDIKNKISDLHKSEILDVRRMIGDQLLLSNIENRVKSNRIKDLEKLFKFNQRIAFITDEQLLVLNERYGYFEHGDVQGDVSRAFADDVSQFGYSNTIAQTELDFEQAKTNAEINAILLNDAYKRIEILKAFTDEQMSDELNS